MSNFSVEDVETPEDVIALQDQTNYWVDSAPKAKFFLVDASYVVLLFMSTLDLQNPRTAGILAVAFVIFMLLEWKDITFTEFYESVKLRIARKKSLRH